MFANIKNYRSFIVLIKTNTMSTIKKNKKIARLKSNIWGNYYLLIGNKKVRDWKGKQSNKEEIESFLKENYPDYELKDLTEY